MKPLPNEPYEKWAERVNLFEKGRAMQRIAQGDSPELVMEEMSRRIMEKLMHPIYKAIRESTNTAYDAEVGREKYEQQMRYRAPVADHVDGQLFDKSE